MLPGDRRRNRRDVGQPQCEARLAALIRTAQAWTRHGERGPAAAPPPAGDRGWADPGKVPLVYWIVQVLRLGRVLRWRISKQISSRSGVYDCDAIERVEDAAAAHRADGTFNLQAPHAPRRTGRFLHPGPSRAALPPHRLPRVLLVDELDKSGMDLPNDLLRMFEKSRCIPGPAGAPPKDAAERCPASPQQARQVRRLLHRGRLLHLQQRTGLPRGVGGPSYAAVAARPSAAGLHGQAPRPRTADSAAASCQGARGVDAKGSGAR